MNNYSENKALSPSSDKKALAPLNRWGAILMAYLQTLDSDSTKRAYRRAVEIALPALGDLDSLTALDLTAYRDMWLARLSENHPHPLAPATVKLHMDALRSFLKFARLTGKFPLSNEVISFALKSPKAEVVKPYQVLTDREFGRLLVATRDNLRNRMIFTLADATGLRESELCRLRVGDLHIDDEGDTLLRVRRGKGNKDRIVPLDKQTAALVSAYLQSRKLEIGNKKDNAEYVFASRKGKGRGRLSTSRLRQLMAYYLRKARIQKNISMHSLRHGAGLRWVRRTRDTNAVRLLLGHSDLKTTQKYLDHLNAQDLKKVVNA